MKRLLQFKTLAIALCLGMNVNAQVLDGSFEAGPGGGSWIEASTNFGTPLCSEALCGTGGGPCVPKTGTFYSWFGGASGGLEAASLEQAVVIPNGTTGSIKLWVKIANAGPGLAGDKIEVRVDGNVLATVTALDSVAYADYTQLSVDVSSLTDGLAHTLRIEGLQSTAAVCNILVDDVDLTVDGVTVSLLEEFMEPKFNVFPNPANDVINVTFGELNGDALVSVIAIDGTIVSQEMILGVFNKNFGFSTENMENGVYIVEVTNEGTVTTQRVIVAK